MSQKIFKEIYEKNGWKGNDSISGQGSDLKQTATIRKTLPPVLSSLGIKSILDIPCGDFFWFKEMHLEDQLNMYIGADIVPELIEENRRRYTVPAMARYFEVLDATNDKLPEVDLIFCRDMLGHLSNTEVKKTLRNFKNSGAKWLMATTFPGRENQVPNIETGQWRPIDLNYMWGLPECNLYLNEGCTEANGAYADKSLGLWEIN